jgi:hypothetical protein
MKYQEFFFIIVTLGCLQIARASQDANPYLSIVAHNPFGLVPTPSPDIQDAKISPPEITLNGIITIFGDKRALFKVRESPAEEKSCLLSEGERDGDIELLSVDVQRSTVTVNNHGVTQTIAICKTVLPSPGANSVAANGGADLPGNFNSGISNDPNQISGAQFQNENGQPTAFQSGYQVGAANSQNPSSAGNGATANNNQNSGTPKIDPWWVRGSKMVEQSRVQSADAVASGTASPLPLTPLTPPGTPANLIGSDQMFFDHM